MTANPGGGDSGPEERVCEVSNPGGGLLLVFTKPGGGPFTGADNAGKSEESSLVFFFPFALTGKNPFSIPFAPKQESLTPQHD